MGQPLASPAKRTRTTPRKWSLPAFQRRAYATHEAIQAACVSLTGDYKFLKRKQKADYRQYCKTLQTVHELRRQTDAWSAVMYNDERLPFLVYVRRYSLLIACFHVQQHAEQAISLLTTACMADHSVAEARLHQILVKSLALVLESGKEITFEITALLDQFRFCECHDALV